MLLAEDDGLVVVHENSVIEVPSNRTGEYDLFEIAAFADEVFH